MRYDEIELLKNYAKIISRKLQSDLDEKHSDKLERLLGGSFDKKRPSPTQNWVRNYSSQPLTQSQIAVLQKGSKFAVAPNKIPTLAFVCGVEQGLHQVKHEKKALINYTRAQVVKILKEAKPPKKNLTIDERKAI